MNQTQATVGIGGSALTAALTAALTGTFGFDASLAAAYGIFHFFCPRRSLFVSVLVRELEMAQRSAHAKPFCELRPARARAGTRDRRPQAAAQAATAGWRKLRDTSRFRSGRRRRSCRIPGSVVLFSRFDLNPRHCFEDAGDDRETLAAPALRLGALVGVEGERAESSPGRRPRGPANTARSMSLATMSSVPPAAKLRVRTAARDVGEGAAGPGAERHDLGQLCRGRCRPWPPSACPRSRR